MTLAIQLVACAGAVALIALLLHGDASRRTVAVSAAGLAAVVVSLHAIQGAWTNAQTQRSAAKKQSKLTEEQANKVGGRSIGVNADFVEWTVQQTDPGDRWYLVGQDPTVTQWLSYRMLPRLTVERPQKGTWLVFYKSTPRKAGYRRSQLDDERTYAPGFSIARLSAGGGTK